MHRPLQKRGRQGQAKEEYRAFKRKAAAPVEDPSEGPHKKQKRLDAGSGLIPAWAGAAAYKGVKGCNEAASQADFLI